MKRNKQQKDIKRSEYNSTGEIGSICWCGRWKS